MIFGSSNPQDALTSAPISIKGIAFSNGVNINIALNAIIIVVGPNNSGKSTLLREIQNYFIDSDIPRKVVSSLSISGLSRENVQDRIGEVYSVVRDGGIAAVYVDRDQHNKFYFQNLETLPYRVHLQGAHKAFVTLLNAETRLELSKDVETYDIQTRKPFHPYHVFMVDPKKLESFSKKIEDAFGVQFRINRIGNPIKGFISNQFNIDDGSVLNDRSVAQIGDHVALQGDGLRSYVGIVAELDAMSHPVVLVDEPEAFLHPPQARRLGSLIANDSTISRQTLIATHSADFLQGALSTGNTNVRVIRVERANGAQSITHLDNEQLIEATNHPAIANTNLLDALFFDQTVICEADADCGLYESLMRSSNGCENQRVDRFWFAMNGKHQAIKIASLLSMFSVDFRVILDLDVIKDWDILVELARLKNLDISHFRKGLADALGTLKEKEPAEIRSSMIEVLQSDIADRDALNLSRRVVDQGRSSAALKQSGVTAIAGGLQRKLVLDLIRELASVGVVVLQKGELESYVLTACGHGPKWVAEVRANIEKYAVELAELRREIANGLVRSDQLQNSN